MPSPLAALALLLPMAAAAGPIEGRVEALSTRLAGELGSARALPDLFRLYELRDEVADLPALGRLFDRIATDRGARADVRAAALELRAQLAVAQGQLLQSRAIVDRAAPVRAWAVIGPFENDGRAGLRTVYPPETAGYDPSAKHPGKDHDVSWRALPQQAFPLGYVDLSSAVWPAQDSTVYAATVVRSTRARTAALHLGASGATRLWVNGKLVHEDTAVHPSRWDQAAFAVELRAGDNSLLLKLAHGTGKPGFSLRICDERDQPLPALASSARVPGGKGAMAAVREAPARRPAARIPDALGELRAAARLHPEDARAQEDLAVLLAWRRPYDDGSGSRSTRRNALPTRRRATPGSSCAFRVTRTGTATAVARRWSGRWRATRATPRCSRRSPRSGWSTAMPGVGCASPRRRAPRRPMRCSPRSRSPALSRPSASPRARRCYASRQRGNIRRCRPRAAPPPTRSAASATPRNPRPSCAPPSPSGSTMPRRAAI